MAEKAGANDIVVVLVVDSEFFAIGFTQALSTRSRLHVAAAALSAADGWKAIVEFAPDVVFIESGMAREVRALSGQSGWTARTLLLGRNEHIGMESPATTQAACGFLSFGARHPHYWPIIDHVALCGVAQAGAGAACRACPVRTTLARPALDLTGRELEVFVLTGRGFRASDIAARLGLSTKTIDAHRESIKQKLGLQSARAVQVAATDWCRGESIARAAWPQAEDDAAAASRSRH